MRRGWAVVLTVLLVTSGMVPSAVTRHCCRLEETHSCCRPMARMLADCCGSRANSSALPAEAQRNVVAAAAVHARVELTVFAIEALAGTESVVEQPRGLHPPPIILRN